MLDSDGATAIEDKPIPRDRRAWIKLLLFVLFVGGFILTCPKPRGPYRFALDHNIIDQGAGWLFSLWMKLLGRWNPDQIVSGVDYLMFVGLVLSLFSLLMLLPKVPLMVTIGGQITLFCVWLAFGESCLDHHGIESWNVCLGVMFIAALGFWKETRWDYFVAASFGLVLGYFPLMRQPAIETPLACGFVLGLLALAAVINLFLRRRAKFREVQDATGDTAAAQIKDAQGLGSDDWSFLRFFRPLAVFFVCFFVMRSGASWIWSVMNNNATMRRHGAGHSLFSSLGFARNPYNLTYSDDCWLTQGLLYEGAPWVDNDVHGQIALEILWRTRVLEDPAMFIRNAFAKSFYVIRYFTGTLNAEATQHDGYPVKPSWITLAMGAGFGVAAFGCMVLFYCLRNDRLLVLTAGSVGLGIASFAQLVIVVPFFLGTAIAYCVGMFFILMPAVGYVAVETQSDNVELQRQRNILVWKLVGVVALALVLAVAGYTTHRFFVNRKEARELLAGDPIQKLNQLRFDFAFRFNRLTVAEQQSVIGRLLSAQSPQPVFRPLPEAAAKPAGNFTPILAVVCDRFVCVAAKMSRDREIPFPSRAQGPKSSVLLVVKNQDRLGPNLEFMESPDKYLKIADANWDGRYRMFVLPASPDYAVDATFLGVSALNFIDGSEADGAVLGLIGGERLYRVGRTPP